jgi:hypothetical protein
MAVLEEVVAEMLQQERASLRIERKHSTEEAKTRRMSSMSHREPRYEEVAHDCVEPFGSEVSSGSADIELFTHYEADEFGELYDLAVPRQGFEEDDDGGLSIDIEPTRVDYGWDAECLQHAEDIDFEFVYALHTFVATVEGQANATKGDTMVLLDDSNSYWWLVRVVKDSSIGGCFYDLAMCCHLLTRDVLGYLPAEHIETPTERLARLNKHRNIDVRPYRRRRRTVEC